MNFNIRKLIPEDIDQVYELGNLKPEFTTHSGSFWTKEQLTEWSKSENDILLIAENEGKIIGFSFYAHHILTKKITWENIYVLPEYRNSGVGSALIKEGLEEVKKLGCKYIMLCANANDQNQFAAYLENLGFKIYGNVLWVDKML